MHKKSAHFERFMINDDKSFYHWYANLLADAEFGEDGVEDVVGGDVAGDLAQVVEGLADVLAEKIRWQVVVHCRDSHSKTLHSLLQGGVVAHIRDHNRTAIQVACVGAFAQCRTKIIYTDIALCRDA